MKRNLLKPVFCYLLVAIGLTIIWNIVVRTLVIPRAFYATEATVVNLNTEAPAIRGGGRQVTTFPTYTYLDDKGQMRTYTSKDGFNAINGFLFKKEVGQKLTAYYEKGSQNGIFITGTGDWYTFLLAPLVFAIFPLGLVLAAVLLLGQKKRQTSRAVAD